MLSRKQLKGAPDALSRRRRGVPIARLRSASSGCNSGAEFARPQSRELRFDVHDWPLLWRASGRLDTRQYYRSVSRALSNAKLHESITALSPLAAAMALYNSESIGLLDRNL